MVSCYFAMHSKALDAILKGIKAKNTGSPILRPEFDLNNVAGHGVNQICFLDSPYVVAYYHPTHS